MTVNRVKEFFILVYFTTAFMFINVSIDCNIKEPLLFDVIFDKNMSAFTLTCELSERPVGGAILVQVNFSSVDSIRHRNNSCYAKDGECQNNTCLCSYEGGKFGMEYWYRTPNVSQSYNFGVEMILKDGKANIVVVTLSRTYNGKDFGKLQIVKEVTEFNSNENIDVTNIGVENNANRLNSWNNVTARLSVGMVLITVFFLIIFCMSHETSFQNKAKKDYQLLSLYTEEGTYSTIYAASKVSLKTANSDATVIQLSNVLQDFQKDTDEIRSLSTVPAKVNKKRIDCVASKVSPKTAHGDATVIQLYNVLQDLQNDPDEIRSTVPAKVNKKRIYCVASKVSPKTAHGDATVIQLYNVLQDLQNDPDEIRSTVSAKVNKKRIYCASGDKTANGNSDTTVIQLSYVREDCQIETNQISWKSTLPAKMNDSESEVSFTTAKSDAIVIALSNLREHVFETSIQKCSSCCEEQSKFIISDFADFSILKVHRDDVLKELSNQIGKSAFHLRMELGASFYYIDGSFLKFLKTLAASVWIRNAGSKLPLTSFSIDELKRVNGDGDRYILKMSK